MRVIKSLGLFALFFGLQSTVTLGQHQHHQDTTTTTHQHDTLSHDPHAHASQHEQHFMPHAFSRNLRMNRNGSGTAWLPDNTPMYGYMVHNQKWMYMFHGNLFLRYNNQDLTNEGTRGNAKVDAPNWFMAMGQREIGKRGLLRFSAMLSLDPLTVGGAGYPLLYQSGETWKGEPLVDRQHPHDLFSELSIAYTHQLAQQTDAFVYLGYPGEPAFGPVAFMHRVSSLYNPDAPLGHHWQDATHITFGVATAGIRHRNFKFEGSIFTGREPNEERYGFDKPRFDSYALRLSFNPTRSLALQLSQAWVNDVHELGAREDISKTTASVIHAQSISKDKFLNSALVWGYNNADHHGEAHSILTESALSFSKTILYGKYEWVQKSDEDLILGDMVDHRTLFNINAFTLGVQQTLLTVFDTHLAIGTQASWYPADPSLRHIYGRNPIAAQFYIRLFPSLMSSGRE